MSTRVTISVGSNAKDREKRVDKAVDWLKSELGEVISSVPYTTEPHSGQGEMYVNAVVVGMTNNSFDDLSKLLKDYEAKCGREHGAANDKTVVIDLDIVIWGERIVRDQDFSRPYFNLGYRELLANGAFEE